MFDGPDVAPLCLAPFVAIFTGLLVYGTILLLDVWGEKITGSKLIEHRSAVAWLCVAFTPIICLASVALDIGGSDQTLWFKPTGSNIVGKWKLSYEPFDDLSAQAQHPDPAKELVFYRDGTFIANEIPDLWNYPNMAELDHVDHISGSGTWRLGQEQGTQPLEWVLFTEFHKIDEQEDVRTMRYYLRGHLPPYKLVAIDSWYLFDFQRK